LKGLCEVKSGLAGVSKDAGELEFLLKLLDSLSE
jgi:hypothetical protein